MMNPTGVASNNLPNSLIASYITVLPRFERGNVTSSAEFLAPFRFRQNAKRMMESDFNSPERAETVGLSIPSVIEFRSSNPVGLQILTFFSAAEE